MCSPIEPYGGSADQRERLFVMGYVLFLFLTLLYLFRSFVFSSDMLYSGDVIAGGVFFRSFLKQALVSSCSIPQWNPLQCCGLPFVGAIHGGAYYPLTYLEIAIGIVRGFGYSFMLHYLLAGTLAYWSARRMGLSRLAASLVGVSYGLSPCIVSWVAPGHDGKIYVATWFPLVVGLAERIFRNGRLADVAWLGLAIALIVLTPHLQLAYYILWFLLAFVLFRGTIATGSLSGFGKQRPLRSFLLIGLGVLIGLLISSVQILPSAHYILNDTSRGTVHRGPDFAGQFALHAEEMASIAIPEFCGTDVRSGPTLYWGKNSFKNNSEGMSALAIYLALLCFVLPGRRHKYFWGLIAGVVLLYALGNATPAFRLLLSIIPALDSMEAPSGATFIAVYAISILAGTALDGIRNVSATSGFRRRLVVAAIIVPPIVIAAAALVTRLDGEQALMQYAQVFYRDLIPGESGQSAAWLRAKANLPNLTVGMFIAASTLIVSCILIWTAYSRRKWSGVLWLIPILVATASIRFDERFIAVCDHDRLLGSTPVTETIATQAGPWRTLEYDIGEGTLQLAYAGIPSPTGLQDRIPFWYFELVGGSSRCNLHNPRLINLTGTRYLVVSRESRIPPNALGTELLDTLVNEGERILLENRNCFPRVFLVNSFEVFADRSVLIDSVLSGSSDLRRTVLLEELPRLQVTTDTAPAGEASIVYYGNDSISVAVSSSCNSFLVLTDNYHSSWHAYGDGRELRVYRADGAFRAVEVAAGTKNIVFVCRSGWVLLGKLLSCGGLLLVGILLIRQWVHRPAMTVSSN
ncbi:MAG: hypothetical protein NT028_14340 [candidate division Zixibacteria bacterium]|nr:hypothetical protein [candidate division Zixibacteria bacterium]